MIEKNAKQLSNLRLCATLFLRVTRALGTFCGSRTASISNPPPSPNVVASHLPRILVCVRVFVRVRVHICVLEKEKKMALTQIPPEEKFYTSMPWW